MKDDTIIGIDTGGTFTDAVLLERKLGKILAWAKVRTDPHDLGSCVREVIEDLIRKDGRARNDVLSTFRRPWPPTL